MPTTTTAATDAGVASSQSVSGSSSAKKADRDEEKKKYVVVHVLDLSPSHVDNPTISTFCVKYARMSSMYQYKNAFKLDLLRMLAVARANR